MSIVKEYFSIEMQALNEEVTNHPELSPLLAACEPNDLGAKLGEIAAYCNIVLDGAYTPAELDKLAGILVHKLKDRNTAIVSSMTKRDVTK